jgi:uracil-DNA glycosylase
VTELLIVGEAPNRRGQGKRANTTFTGGRLAQLGAREIARTNLLKEWPGPSGKGSAFPLELARPAAERLLRRVPRRVHLVLIGTRVAAAFGLPRARYEYLEWRRHRERWVAVCPHPSGVNLWWNDADNRDLAAEFFRQIVDGNLDLEVRA